MTLRTIGFVVGAAVVWTWLAFCTGPLRVIAVQTATIAQGVK